MYKELIDQNYFEDPFRFQGQRNIQSAREAQSLGRVKFVRSLQTRENPNCK